MTHHVTFPDLGLSFDINPTAFAIGDFTVQWYGVIIGFGFLLAIIYAIFSCKKMRIKDDALFDAVIVGLICGVIGARLYYVIFYPGDYYLKNPAAIFAIKDGGLGIYGGIIGGLLGGGIMAKIRKLKVPAVLDLASLGFLIGQGIGRWGNFMNQEAFGTNTDLPWGMRSAKTMDYILSNLDTFEEKGIVMDAVGYVHPTFLYESLWCLLGFGILYLILRKFRKFSGQIFLCYGIWYGIGRTIFEGLRTDSLYIGNTTIRVSQALSAAVVVIFTALLIVLLRKFIKNPQPIEGVDFFAANDKESEVIDEVKEIEESEKAVETETENSEE